MNKAPAGGILLCGFNGCGKSTLGQALADRLAVPFIGNKGPVCFSMVTPAKG